jgi:hypothetical protein
MRKLATPQMTSILISKGLELDRFESVTVLKTGHHPGRFRDVMPGENNTPEVEQTRPRARTLTQA